MITIRRAADLDLETIEDVAFDGQPLSLHPELLEDLRRSHAEMEGALADGRRVYGVNTGMGYLAGKGPRGLERENHQRNLLVGRAVGSPPFLPAPEARALLAARLINLTSPNTGVTPELCRFVVDRLNDGFVPAVPREGVGCAGEVIQLSHAFQTLIGVGQVLGPDGVTRDAADALAERGVAPYEPAPKEGISLLAGSPGTIALAVARLRAARVVCRQFLASTACSIHALRAPLEVYGEHVGGLTGDRVLVDVLRRLRAALRGSGEERSGEEAPVSFRVAPQVLAHVERAVDRFAEDAERSVGSVSDSPIFVDGHFVATGAFHEVDLASGFDSLSAAFVRAAELLGQRIHRLLDRRFSGLPDQLTSNPGFSCGLIVVQKRVVGVLNRLRRLAMPASIGLVDTSLGQEDAMTFGFEAAENLRRVEDLVRDVISCELRVARQAWALRGAGISAGLLDTFEQLADVVEPVEQDRPLGPDLSRIVALLGSGGLAPEFEEQAGRMGGAQ